MRRAGRVVAEMHEVCIRREAGCHDPRRRPSRARRDRPARRPVELPRPAGFPAVVCTSPNDVIVHGIPSDSVVLEDGDILSVDCGAIVEGWHADAAVTVPVGEVDDESKRLIEVTRKSLEAAIEQVVEGNRLGDVGAAVEGIAESAGFSVVREYVGHGIGTAMHEDPQVPNYGPPGRGLTLKPGHVLAIRPMVNAGDPPPRCSTTAGPWSPTTASGRPASSTRSRSPTMAPRCSPSW